MLDWLAANFVRGLSALLCRVPPEAALWLGRRAGDFTYAVSSRRVRLGIRNLRAAFPGRYTPVEARRVIRTCYRHIGASTFELLRLPVIDRAYAERYVELPVERFQAAARTGRPVIYLTAHYGSWELSAIAAALAGFPMVVLARAQANFPRLYRLLVSYRESKGCTVAHKGGAMRRLLRALDERRAVGILADQATRHGDFLDFFGRPALFARGPFELAYDKRALVIPVFIRRLRGPFHRLEFEPPIDLRALGSQEAAVREGQRRYAEALARHIREDPTQWLWMHQRWKYTPARQVLVLSDGKLGHLKQSLAVVEALAERTPQVSHDVVEVRYRSRAARGLAVVWSVLVPRGWGAAGCLAWALTRESARDLLSRTADLIVSCGSSTVPVTALWSADNQAKSIVIMNPAPLPVRRFSLVIAPRHDGLPQRGNVVQVMGAVSGVAATRLAEAAARLREHPKFRAAPGEAGSAHPVIAVLLGGETDDYDMPAGFAESLIQQVLAACEDLHAWCLVTTSRRTPHAVEQALTERLGAHPRCRLLLLASRDPLDGTLDGMLGSADAVVVTGESISMVSEACASGRPVVVVEPPLRRLGPTRLTKHRRFLRSLAEDGYAQLHPVPEVGHAVQRLIRHPKAARPLESYRVVRDAVARLL